MQVFVPYSNIIQVVKEMACDKRRYNKQIVECNQIIKAIEGISDAWSNHPICIQYRRYIDWLIWYKDVFEMYRNKNYIFSEEDEKLIDSMQPKDNIPNFIFNQEYLDNHKKRLFQKAPELYPQFKNFDIEGDKCNMYCVPLDFILPKRKGVEEYKIFNDYKIIKYV